MNPIYDLSCPAVSRVVPATWPYDKYPDMPELKAGSTVTLLDTDGPGIVTSLHASHYLVDGGMGDGIYARSVPAASRIILRVFYDFQEKPAVEMPFFDFFGDLDGCSGFFATRWFSKVPMSHNFRLPMPFFAHIRITLENSSHQDLMGYTDVQYDKKKLPNAVGYLRTQVRGGRISVPGEPVCLFEAEGPGCIAAHWFIIEGRDPGFDGGEGLCEANCEFYLDGGREPACNYLGVEDLYGFSWGFQGEHSDGYGAIVRKDDLEPGARIGILRCREEDAIRYQSGCRAVMDYRQEYFSPMSVNPIHRTHPVFASRRRYENEAMFRTCFYYYG